MQAFWQLHVAGYLYVTQTSHGKSCPGFLDPVSPEKDPICSDYLDQITSRA